MKITREDFQRSHEDMDSWFYIKDDVDKVFDQQDQLEAENKALSSRLNLENTISNVFVERIEEMQAKLKEYESRSCEGCDKLTRTYFCTRKCDYLGIVITDEIADTFSCKKWEDKDGKV